MLKTSLMVALVAGLITYPVSAQVGEDSGDPRRKWQSTTPSGVRQGVTAEASTETTVQMRTTIDGQSRTNPTGRASATESTPGRTTPGASSPSPSRPGGVAPRSSWGQCVENCQPVPSCVGSCGTLAFGPGQVAPLPGPLPERRTIAVRTRFGVVWGVPLPSWSTEPAAAPTTVVEPTPWTAVGPVPHIDPWAVAVQATHEVPIPPIALRANPDPGRVNVDSWFWVEGYGGETISHSKTVEATHTECRINETGESECRMVDDSVTVVVHLTPTAYAWTFGDNRNNSVNFTDSRGLGRAYTDPNPRNASPVAHAYHWSSINYLSQGGYPVTLRITWSAEFSANGAGPQRIPDVSRTFEGRHQVRQIQSVVQR
jgi:hypothetical protein